MLPTPAFSIDTVARLTGLSRSRLRRWDTTGFFNPSYALPDRRKPYSRIYSFEDVVVLRAVVDLQERGVSRDRLRQLIHSYADAPVPGEWTDRRLYVLRGDIFFTQEEVLAAAQTIEGSADLDIDEIDLASIAEEVREDVDRLSVRTPDQIGRVTRDRYIMNGEPILAGTRIPTVTVYDFARRGVTPAEIVASYPRLTEEDVAAAVAFEEQRRYGDGDLKLATG
jgi:uncharacterized protein (DUF433 family)